MTTDKRNGVPTLRAAAEAVVSAWDDGDSLLHGMSPLYAALPDLAAALRTDRDLSARTAPAPTPTDACPVCTLTTCECFAAGVALSPTPPDAPLDRGETWRCPSCRDTTAPMGMCQRCGIFGLRYEAPTPPDAPGHRPQWIDGVPTGWCECGAPYPHVTLDPRPAPDAALREAVAIVYDVARRFVPRGAAPHTPNGHDCEACAAMRTVDDWLAGVTLAPTPTDALDPDGLPTIDTDPTPSDAALPLGEPAMHAHDGLGVHRAETHHRPQDYRADVPATFPLDLDTFNAGLDSPWHTPESRKGWIALFYRDMRMAAATVTRDPSRGGHADVTP